MIVEKTVQYGSVRTRVLEVAGSGTPYVLLHGFTDSADTWRSVLGEYARRGRAALALDLPGFGQADPLAAGEVMRQFDAFVDQMLETYDSVILMGNSLGAGLAVRAAARQNPAVRAAVALDEPFLSDHRIVRYVRREREPWGFTVIAAGLPVPDRVVNWVRVKTLPRLLYGNPRLAEPEVIKRWTAAKYDSRQMGKILRQARQVALETRTGYQDLDRICCPLLIIHGGKDRIIPVSSSRRLHRAVPGSELCILPQCGHCPQLDAPEEVTDLVLRFEKRHSPQA
jgi:pimeloyl-ACP methyl ester carboxylesterase